MIKIRSDLRPILAGTAAMLLVSLVYVHLAPDVQPIAVASLDWGN